MNGANRLRVMRAERRISQLRLALQAGINQTRLWRIENGFAVATPNERRALARGLGMSEADIWAEGKADRRNAVG